MTNQPSAVDFGRLLKPLIRKFAMFERPRGKIIGMTKCILRYGEDFRFYLDVLLTGGSTACNPRSLLPVYGAHRDRSRGSAPRSARLA